MSDTSIYMMAWLVYIGAGAGFYFLFWRLTRSDRYLLMSYCARALMLSLIATPWYVDTQSNDLAPALIVVMMDAITISGASAARAFVPLFLSLCLSLAVAVGLFILRKRRLGQRAS